MNNLRSRLIAFIAGMQPHQKTREQGKLLIEATKEIERLDSLVGYLKNQLDGER